MKRVEECACEGTGILLCGLNGSGKSTLGRALAERLGFHLIDNEDLFFPKTDPNYTFAAPRPKSEVIRLLMEEVKAHKNFIFAAVRFIPMRCTYTRRRKFGCNE